MLHICFQFPIEYLKNTYSVKITKYAETIQCSLFPMFFCETWCRILERGYMFLCRLDICLFAQTLRRNLLKIINVHGHTYFSYFRFFIGLIMSKIKVNIKFSFMMPQVIFLAVDSLLLSLHHNTRSIFLGKLCFLSTMSFLLIPKFV